MSDIIVVNEVNKSINTVLERLHNIDMKLDSLLEELKNDMNHATYETSKESDVDTGQESEPVVYNPQDKAKRLIKKPRK